MKLFSYGKDGGEESHVCGFWLIEIKWLLSIAILVFEDGSREAYHSHAFNCLSWVLSGKLNEYHLDGLSGYDEHVPSIWPVVTKRSTFHRVVSCGRTVVLTFRGPWADTWAEWIPNERRNVLLTHGRRELTDY